VTENMNTMLCGLPMSGKTTVGKILAQQLNFHFVDIDQLIEKAYAAKMGKTLSCRQIFLQEGERIFREVEKQQIVSLIGAEKTVISLGGGSLTDQSNINTLQLIGPLIYLKVSTNILWKRMQMYGIPPYLDSADPEKAFYVLAEKRTPLYEKLSDTIIEADLLNAQEIITSILKKV